MTEPWQTFELTWRCAQSRFLMRPSHESNRRILGVLGQAQRLYGDHVRLYFAGGTCNHIHIIGAFRTVEHKAQWTCHVRTNLSKELGALHDWPGAFWDRRSRDIPILDDDALYDRLVYVAAQTTKAGLVHRAVDWPGVPWIQAVTEGRPLNGTWYDRSRLYRLRQSRNARQDKGSKPTLRIVAEDRTVVLSPPPMWSHLTASDLQARWRRLVAEAEERHAAPDRVVGRARLVALDPHTRPERSAHSPAPAVHTRFRHLRARWHEAYQSFVEAYARAMAALAEGIDLFDFPVQGHRPMWKMQVPGG